MSNLIEAETIYRGRINLWAHISAGGILLRSTHGIFEVFLLKESAEADGWNFPRGTMSDEGNVIKTAIREVEEETGYNSAVIAYLGSVVSQYLIDKTEIEKTTLYHVLAPIKQTSLLLSEHIEGAWFDSEQVASKLRQDTGRELEHAIWQRFLQWLSLQDHSALIKLLNQKWQGGQ